MYQVLVSKAIPNWNLRLYCIRLKATATPGWSLYKLKATAILKYEATAFSIDEVYGYTKLESTDILYQVRGYCPFN